MRILINALSARMGGGQTYIRNILGHLPNDPDLEILVYAPQRLALNDDPRITRLSARWPTENPVLRTAWEALVLPRILSKQKVQLLFCPGGIVATRAPKSCRTVTMFRNMLPFDEGFMSGQPFGYRRLKNLLLRGVMLHSLSKADLSIFISEYARSVIEKLVSISHAITIPHGINSRFKTYDQSQEKPDWLPHNYLLYVSRFDVYKHQLEVVKAYAGLPENLRQQFHLLLVGETDLRLTSEVMRFTDKHGLSDAVQIVGAVNYDELPALYHHASANLFASSCENCPNILLEALGAGKAVLCSSVNPMPEFGHDAVAYFDPFDENSLTPVLQRVLEDEQYRETLEQNARIRSEVYDWQKTAERTWKELTSLAG